MVTLDGFQRGLQIGLQMILNLGYADDIILLATSEAELQGLVDRLDRVSHKYSLLINVNKTKCKTEKKLKSKNGYAQK